MSRSTLLDDWAARLNQLRADGYRIHPSDLIQLITDALAEMPELTPEQLAGMVRGGPRAYVANLPDQLATAEAIAESRLRLLHACAVLLEDMATTFAADCAEPAAPGVWIHNFHKPHPCEYACGAVYLEKMPPVGDDDEPRYMLAHGSIEVVV